MTSAEPLVERCYSRDELTELRRNTLRYARSFPPGDRRNQHRQLAVSLRLLFKSEKWLQTHTRAGALLSSGRTRSERNLNHRIDPNGARGSRSGQLSNLRIRWR
jgi:hypothetical protein